MARWYKYALARLQAHPTRQESLNVGIIIFNDEYVDVRPAKSLDKVRAISAALDQTTIRDALFNLRGVDRVLATSASGTELARLQQLTTISPFAFSDLASFEAASPAAYEQRIAMLMTHLVEPEPAPFRKSVRKSKLLSAIKASLRQDRVLARKGEDLSSHRVIAGWRLAEGLSADLVLQNGKMHVLETVDAASDDISLRKIISDIAVSALTLEQARIVFGREETKARIIYSASASNEEVLKPSLRAAEHQGTELVNWLSQDDRNKLLTEINKLAIPFEPNAKGSSNVNASVHQRSLLN